MTFQEELTTLTSTISNIKQEISDKGQTIQEHTSCIELPSLIDNIRGSGKPAQKTLQEVVTGEIKYLYDDVSIYLRPYCFRGCKYLEKAEFTILNKICLNAFHSCYRLKTLILSGHFVRLDDINAFSFTPMQLGDGIIYVPDNLYNTYLADENWYYYREHIKPISYQGTDNKIVGTVLVAPDDWYLDQDYYFES